MRILVLGAGGFIGRQIMAALLAERHDVVAVVRKVGNLGDSFPQAVFVEMDLARQDAEAIWHDHFQSDAFRGITHIVNAAGILRGPQMAAIHVDMPLALYAAAGRAGVEHILLISAISARAEIRTDYSQSKLSGEAVLRASGVRWTILRPSLVYGDGSYGGTSLLRGMAALPGLIPLPGQGTYDFTPIHVGDLARGVVRICGDASFAGQQLEPVGPETLDLRTLLRCYRAWLGFGRARFLTIPIPVMRALGRIGDMAGDGPIASNSLAQLIAGNAGDSAAYARQIGFEQRRLDDALLLRPAEVQDRWHARLFFLAPAIRAMLILLWLASAWLGFVHGGEATRDLVASLGLTAAAADPLRIGASLADIAVAALVLSDRKARWSTIVQIGFIAGYTVVIGLALPHLWFDPLGPLIKNLPILLLVAVHGVVGDKR